MGNKIIKNESKIEDYVDVKSNLDSDYKSHVYDDNNNDNGKIKSKSKSITSSITSSIFGESVKNFIKRKTTSICDQDQDQDSDIYISYKKNICHYNRKSSFESLYKLYNSDNSNNSNNSKKTTSINNSDNSDNDNEKTPSIYSIIAENFQYV